MSLINDALKRASKAVKKQGSEPAEGTPMEPVETPESPVPPPVSDDGGGGGGGGKKWLILALLVVVLGLAGFFFYKAYPKNKAAQSASTQAGTNVPAKGTLAAAGKGTNAAAPAQMAKGPANSGSTNVAKKGTNILVRSVQTAAAVAEKVSLQNREGEAAAYAIQPGANPPATTSATTQAATPPPAAVPAERVTAPAPAPPPVAQSNADFPAVMKLQAIFYRLKGASAVINGETMHIGDMLDGAAKVTKIERDSVTVAIGARERVLTLKQ